LSISTVMPLTARGDIFAMATPGHTVGHQSVVIDLGDRQVVLAGDAAFDDGQVDEGIIPGIIENRSLALATYDTLRRMKQLKPTLMVFTHDERNGEKLSGFVTSQAFNPVLAAEAQASDVFGRFHEQERRIQ
jgi:glyoxylase-like metal-dependent hydrolase (beta-lactamase superfamily II)